MAQESLRQLLEQAMQHLRAGQADDAKSICTQILVLQPREANALHLLGLIAHSKGEKEEAANLIRRAISISPNAPAFHSNLGQVLLSLGRENEALTALQRALELRPESAEILCNLGNLLVFLNRPSEAVPLLEKAIALKPEDAPSYSNLGNAQRLLGQTGPAIQSLDRAVRLSPNSTEYQNNLGNALHDAGRIEEAIIAFERAIALQPQSAEAHNNLGTSLRQLGKWNQALGEYRQAIALQPEYAMPHFNLGLMLLMLGQFEKGWQENEWRWKVREHRLDPDRLPMPMWDGSDLNGRTLLLYTEQGFGDAIQFVRYAELLANRGGKIVLQCHAELKRLFLPLAGLAQVSSRDEPAPTADLRCPLLSLPLLFKTELHNIPASIPYLHANPERVEKWSHRLAPDGRRRVGIAWAGRPTHRNDRERSISIQQLAPLAKNNVRFISLQKGTVDASGPLKYDDWTNELTDFAETAALIENLDLVICVDTAVAHLAGAMGKPVWVMLPYVADWRWLLDRTDTPWYPTMRLFRQTHRQDWTAPIEQIARELDLL